MTVPVPTSLPVVSGWSLADWLDRGYTSGPAEGGVALLTLPAVPDGDRWQLTHVVASCTSTAATQMRLYFDDPTAAGLRDGTSAGNFDVADWPMGLWVPPGRALVAQWTGCDDGAVGYLSLQANIYQRTS